ncbi:MAG TPA: YcjX family protein, partial [Tabrizicola sp.]|nr:YcjX family protein [Tabrizicola sp.]
MAFSGLTDGIARGIEGAGASLGASLFDTTLRLGVTGLSRAGKTVFITALVANLLNRGRMPQLKAEAEGRIQSVYLQPQPDLTLPRFDYETHLAALTGDAPRWPASTRAISELRLSFRVQPGGFLSSWRGPQTLHLDIVDYPGEWLLDLGLLDQSYDAWSEATLIRLEKRSEAADFVAHARAEDGALRLDEGKARALADSFTAYLTAARDLGRVDVTPGRFLLPGDLAGSPVLTFAPLPKPAHTPRNCLWREMERRYEAYKSKVVRPFFRDHFSRIDRQVV